MKLKHFLFFCSICLIIFSCSQPPIDICKINENPSAFAGVIQIQGVVTATSAIAGVSTYILKSTSNNCQLMILSNKISPDIGKYITIKGSLKELYNFDNNRQIVFCEEGFDFNKLKNNIGEALKFFLN